MYSVINIMIYLPAIILLAKCLLLESGGIEIVSGNSKVEGDPIYANSWLWAMPNTALFCFLAIFTIIVESTFAGLCWAWIEEKYSRKRQGLIKGMSCWDKLFYDQGQMYVYLRLKIGGCLYGLWGREPSRVDTSFTPDPGIVVEQCDEKFTPLGTFIWISRENIALMQIIWRDDHERKKD